MKARILTLTTLCLLGLTAPIQAQDSDRGQLYEMSIMKVSPEDMGAFMEAAGMIREAAEAANLPGEYNWQMWMRDSEIAIVSTVDDMAAFDDPEAWMRAFIGTPGEEMLQAAFQKFESEVWAENVSREVWELEESWSYAPAESQIEAVRFAEMHEFWIKPGMQEEFEEAVGGVMAFFAEMPGRYAVNGFRTHFGETGRASFVVFNDNWGEFYGEHSLEAGLESSGMGDRWEGLMASLSRCMIDQETSQWTYLTDISYTAPSM